MLKNAKPTYLLFLIVIILSIVFLGFEFYGVGDFQIYIHASFDLNKGYNIYEILYGTEKIFPYLSSPSLAFLLTPFVFEQRYIGALIWKFLNILLLIRIWKLIEYYTLDFSLSNRQRTIFLAFTFASSSFLIYRNFHLVQFTIFLLFTLLEGIHQLRKGNNVLGAFCFSIGILTKVLPLVIIPYLFFRGYFKAIFIFLVSLFFLIILPGIAIGFDQNIFLYSEWIEVINPFKSENVFDVSTRTIHGLGSLLSTLFIPGIGSPNMLPLKRNILSVNPEVVKYIIYGVKICLIFLTVYVLKLNTIFKKEPNKLKLFWEISFILLVTPLIFPQQRSYSFLLAMPALGYLIFGFIYNDNFRKTKLTAILVFSIIILNLDLILGQFRQYYWHYKTLTYAAITILSLLIYFNPRRIIGNTVERKV